MINQQTNSLVNKLNNISFNKYVLLTILLNVLFVLFVYLNGYFEIGLLSDSYEDIFNSLNHSFTDYFSDVIYQGRFRPLLFIFLKSIVFVNNLLGFSYDNFFFYNFINLCLYIFAGLFASMLLISASQNYLRAILINIFVLIYPNNIINLCWTASFFEIISLLLILLHILFVLKLLKTDNIMWGYFSILVYILSLLLKEINITIPFLSLIFLLLLKVKHSKVLWGVIGSEIIILFVYLLYRIFNISIIDYRNNSLSGIFDITIKAVLSVLIPGDYVTTYIKIISFDIILLIYIALVLSILVYSLFKYRLKLKRFFLISILFFLSISPYYYAGYIRPQLILIPFSLLIASIFISKKGVNISMFAVIIIFALITFYAFNSSKIIEGWKSSYFKSKERITSLIEFLEYNKDDFVIIGNINRVSQFYMFDRINFIFNYWKNKGFHFSDNISNILSISTINPILDSVCLEYKRVDGRISINTNSDLSFINVSEKYEKDKNEYVFDIIGTVNIIKRNNFNKITEIEFLPFDNKIKIIIFDGKNIRYLN